MHELNEAINDKEVRLIGSQGEQLGIMSSAEALRIADEQGLDLVKISPQATPPVCKLMNYGKFRFEQSKREKEARKNQHVVEIKEIRMSPGIDIGDFNTKLKNAQKFIADGNRVKVSVRFRGREMAHTSIGRDLLERFAEQCAETANLDKAPKLEGRMMSRYDILPMCNFGSKSLLSQKLFNVLDDYNPLFQSYGPRRYNYSDAEWETYVDEQIAAHGQLQY